MLQLVIETAEAGMISRKVIPLGNHQRVTFRLSGLENVIFVGKDFPSDEHKEHPQESEQLQVSSAPSQPIRNFSDELMEYARKACLFSAVDLSRILLLKKPEKVRIIAKEIIEREYDKGETCFRPIPEEVIAYIRQQSALYKDFC